MLAFTECGKRPAGAAAARGTHPPKRGRGNEEKREEDACQCPQQEDGGAAALPREHGVQRRPTGNGAGVVDDHVDAAHSEEEERVRVDGAVAAQHQVDPQDTGRYAVGAHVDDATDEWCIRCGLVVQQAPAAETTKAQHNASDTRCMAMAVGGVMTQRMRRPDSTPVVTGSTWRGRARPFGLHNWYRAWVDLPSPSPHQ